MLNQQPRLAYHQPEALCRTLAYYWGGYLLLTDAKETQIIATLVSFVSGPTNLPNTRGVHDHATQTKAYARKGGWSDTISLPWKGRQFGVAGYTIETRHEFQKTVHGNADTNIDDHIGVAGTSIASVLSQTDHQSAFVLSLHYTYPATGRDSAHSMGIFHSRGGLGSRKPGTRFFDPNVGSWQFSTTQELVDFYRTDWLKNFVAGTMPADPGHQ